MIRAHQHSVLDLEEIKWVGGAMAQPLTSLRVDVSPSGEAFNLYDTILRLRYRDDMAKPSLMVRGKIYRVELAGIVTGNEFLPGHRVRIEIAGSNFPWFERNLQTGGRNHDETVPQPATIKIYHDREHASYVELSLAPER